MFVVLLHYKKPLEVVDQHLGAHRAYLEQGYQQNFLMASGPQEPRTGGVMLSQLQDRHQLEAFLAQDPFALEEIADYQVIDFSPVKYHPQFSGFIPPST